jgi:hypothetical protein
MNEHIASDVSAGMPTSPALGRERGEGEAVGRGQLSARAHTRGQINQRGRVRTRKKIVLHKDRAHHVPRVYENGHVEFLRLFEYLEKFRVMEGSLIHVGSDLDAREAERSAPLELRNGEVRVLHRDRAQAHEAVWLPRDRAGHVIVEKLCPRHRRVLRRMVGHENGDRREHVRAHAPLVAVPHAPLDGPERFVDLAQLGAVRLQQPRLLRARDRLHLREAVQPDSAHVRQLLRGVVRVGLHVRVDVDHVGLRCAVPSSVRLAIRHCVVWVSAFGGRRVVSETEADRDADTAVTDRLEYRQAREPPRQKVCVGLG